MTPTSEEPENPRLDSGAEARRQMIPAQAASVEAGGNYRHANGRSACAASVGGGRAAVAGDALPQPAKGYIHCVCAAGIVAILSGFSTLAWPHDSVQLAAYLTLTVLISALKLRLPGLTGTMSAGFVFVLLGVAELSLPETILLACAGVIVQCYWRASRRPGLVQVLFNVSAAATGASLAYRCAHPLAQKLQGDAVTIPMAVAACIYYLTTSLLVSGVLARLEAKPLRVVWQRCYLLSFPYYLLGGGIAGLMTASDRQTGWTAALLILPVMALAYQFWRIYFGTVNFHRSHL